MSACYRPARLLGRAGRSGGLLSIANAGVSVCSNLSRRFKCRAISAGDMPALIALRTTEADISPSNPD
jgi:hypothetical protein